VLREACRQNRSGRKPDFQRPPLPSISRLAVCPRRFADTVAAILEETGQSAENLVLELTESIVMHDFSESAAR